MQDNSMMQFNGSDEEIDSSTTSYTLLYYDSLSGIMCDLVTIELILCQSRACSHEFKISSSSCLTTANINVTAFGSNVFGDGPTSSPSMIS